VRGEHREKRNEKREMREKRAGVKKLEVRGREDPADRGFLSAFSRFSFLFSRFF
jgi:hypothetical protein